MDIFTHSVSWYLLKKWFHDIDSKKILLLFIVWALFPDIDIIWSYNNYNLHRVITHSLIIIPFITTIPAAIFFYIFKQKVKFTHIYLILFSWILTHIFLDTILIWWTPFFWPFFDNYYSLNIYQVVIEPLFLPIYLFFLLYLLKIIKIISKRTIKVITVFMLWIFILKFWILTYSTTFTNLEKPTSIWLIRESKDLVFQRYYNIISIWDNEIQWEVVDIYKSSVIDSYTKNTYNDTNNLCSNLQWFFLPVSSNFGVVQ
jgi:membrane-bound metal-dependent hydrolase YbcI (DUF457 family)